MMALASAARLLFNSSYATDSGTLINRADIADFTQLRKARFSQSCIEEADEISVIFKFYARKWRRS